LIIVETNKNEIVTHQIKVIHINIMSSTYKHYDIEISQTKSECVIRIIDNKFFKLYQQSFDMFSIEGLGFHTIDNFVKICIRCFNSITSNGIQSIDSDLDEQYSIVSFDDLNKLIRIEMYYKNMLVFNVPLEIPLIQDTELSGSEIVIQKLSQDIIAAKKQINVANHRMKLMRSELDNLIDCVEIPVYSEKITVSAEFGSGDTHILKIIIPIKSPRIRIVSNTNTNAERVSTIINTDNEINIPNLNGLMTNFQLIQCDEMHINNHHITNTENYPKSIKVLIFNACWNFNTPLNIAHMQNLGTLKFENCPDLIHIYESIKLLNIETVVIKNCPKFADSNILTQHEIAIDIT
jgi:hypothetical protein